MLKQFFDWDFIKVNGVGWSVFAFINRVNIESVLRIAVSFATLVYIVFKIIRMWRDKKRSE